MIGSHSIRPATAEDAPSIAEIYKYHVENGTATFDIVPPDVAFWTSKIRAILDRGAPFLVFETGGQLAGYAYVAQFRDRPAYASTGENSIYLAPWATGQGIGTALLRSLISEAREAGFEQLIAVIGGGEPASVAVHAKCGFSHAGLMRAVGRKFGKTLDTVYMQIDLTEA